MVVWCRGAHGREGQEPVREWGVVTEENVRALPVYAWAACFAAEGRG